MADAQPPSSWRQRLHARLHRTRHALARSLRARLMLVFLLLALALSVAFLGGMRRAFGAGWQDVGRPLVADYVDRLTAQIGSPPDVAVAQALVRRLPLSVRISGPQVQWSSHPARRPGREPGQAWDDWDHDGTEPKTDAQLLVRHTADGHRIAFGLHVDAWQAQPRRVGWWTLAALLALTLAAYAYVRRLLAPLDDIHAGAARFATGGFGQPIPVRRPDELGELAQGVNTMARELHAMLEAKRGLLLAISHELRSPLTRARVNAELLPEDAGGGTARAALLRDLNLMRDLVTDLLEGERLSQGHAALHLEPTDAATLAREVMAQLAGAAEAAGQPQPALVLEAAPGLPPQRWDRARMRLLLRNLLDNALRHGAGASAPPTVRLTLEDGTLLVAVRDHGPGVDPALLDRLAEPFFRPDAARERATGGIGLGLHLCRLVAQAHGGRMELRNAHPGLEARVRLPAASAPDGAAAADTRLSPGRPSVAGSLQPSQEHNPMSTQEIATTFTDMCKQGEFAEAGKSFWSPEIVSLEPQEGDMARAEGLSAVMAKGQWWYENHEIHKVDVEGPYVHGDQFVVRFTMDVTPKGGERMSMDEVGLYTVKDGKIIEERFFYGQ